MPKASTGRATLPTVPGHHRAAGGAEHLATAAHLAFLQERYSEAEPCMYEPWPCQQQVRASTSDTPLNNFGRDLLQAGKARASRVLIQA